MSEAATDDWPSHTQELTRKMNDQLARYVQGHADGKISNRELYIVAGALWHTCAGLTFETDLRTLEQVHAAARVAYQLELKRGK